MAMAVEWVRLRLDLDTFDDAQFAPYLQRCQQSGISFTTMAGIGDTAGSRRELNKACSADIPGRGEFYTFDDYSVNASTRPEAPAQSDAV
jgi:hypothetical protein